MRREPECDPQEAGSIHALIIRFAEVDNEEYTVYELGDGVSENIAQVWSVLFDDDCLKEDVEEEFDVCCTNVFLIDNVQIKPGFHGFGLGRAAVERVIQLFAKDFELVVLKPFPLQWQGVDGDAEKTALRSRRARRSSTHI